MAYNGWKNKETWLVNLWLGDSLAMYQEDGFTIDAAFVEQMVDEMVDEEVSGLISDLLNCALYEIDYDEIAEHYESQTTKDNTMYVAKVLIMDVYEWDNENGEGEYLMSKDGYELARAETVEKLRYEVDEYFGHRLEVNDYEPEFLQTCVVENEDGNADDNGKYIVHYTIIAEHVGRVTFD